MKLKYLYIFDLVKNRAEHFKVSFPKTGSGSEEVTLKGAKDCVAEAMKRLLDITKELDNQVTINCVIPQVRRSHPMPPLDADLCSLNYLLQVLPVIRTHDLSVR